MLLEGHDLGTVLPDKLGTAYAQAGTSGGAQPAVQSSPYGLFPFWMSADTSKPADYYRWLELPGLSRQARPLPPPGSFSTIQAGKDAMTAWKLGAQQGPAQQPAATRPWNLFPAPDMSPVPSTTPWSLTLPQMGISPAISPMNWGPRPPEGAVPTPFYKRPLVWAVAGGVVALGALLLTRRNRR